MAHLAFRAEWVGEAPWAGEAAAHGGERAVGAGEWWCCASCPLASGSGWLGSLTSCRKQNAHSSLSAHLEVASHPFLHGELVPAFSLRCCPCKATLMLVYQNWAMGAEDFRRKKPFAFCPPVLTGCCCIKVQEQSYAHQGGNFSWRKSITRKGFKTAGKGFIPFAFPVLNPIWIRKIAAIRWKMCISHCHHRKQRFPEFCVRLKC